jgi:sugar lactone lactonase YvrE
LGILKFTDDLNVFHHILPNVYVYHLQAYNDETALVEGYLKLRFNSNNSFQLDSVAIPDEIKRPFYPSAKCVVDANGAYWLLYNNHLKSYSADSKDLRIISIKDKLKRETVAAMQINLSDNTKPDFLFIDRHDNLWFQCYGKMMSYNIAADSLTVYHSLPVFMDADRSFQIMYEDVKGTLWITTSKDFYSYDPYNGKTKFFYHISNDTNTVVSSNVSCFCDDPLQPVRFLWIGTRGSGLSRLDKLTGHCKSLSVKNGLPNNVIYGLLTDDAGDLWGSTNKGLFRLNVKTGNIKSFDVTDGLQGNEFNRFAYLKLGNGMLIFGGLNGINYFSPKDIRPISPPRCCAYQYQNA